VRFARLDLGKLGERAMHIGRRAERRRPEKSST
jgi:hypothetical protein